MLSYPDASAEVMWHLITDPAHGYSQYARAGDGTVETLWLSDETMVSVHGGDYDCSEGIRMCIAAVGLIAWDYNESYMWTGNEPAILKGAGYVEVSPHDARVGDVLLRYSGHTEMVLGGWGGELLQGGFRISETGGIYGEQGDQTGWESTYSALDPDAWDVAFRYAGPPRENTQPTTKDDLEDEMICLIKPNGENRMVYVDGANVHPLAHPDEMTAIQDVYRMTHGGREIPTFEYGTKEAPWAGRLFEALSRKE